VHLIPAMGPARTAWLRLTIGALIFLAPGAELWTDPADNPSHAGR
jgi:threonine/homoserine efflux transporter RhtA